MNTHQHIKPVNKCGNTTAAKPLFFQPKLTINQPNDIYEQEADHMADKVMRMTDTSANQNTFFKPANKPVQRKCQHCEEEETHVHRKEGNGGDVQGSNELDTYVGSLNSSGQPMPASSRQFFEPRFGHDFSNVKVHTGAVAAKSAQSINALAYTSGNNIVFNNGQYAPESDSGKKLMAHELTHIVQQERGIVKRKIQRQVNIDDVADEMAGKLMQLTEDDGALKAGDTVIVKTWNGTSPTANVDHITKGVKTTAAVSKYKLKPSLPSAAGVRHYDAGVAGQKTAVKDSMQKVAEQQKVVDEWSKKESSYGSNHDVWQNSLNSLENELKRREGVAKNKQVIMSQILVKEEMYNRFDTIIKKWVDFYNASITPTTNLDSNVVKSLIYKETKMGTNGFHLQLGPYSWSDIDHHPIKSRYNLGQTIDSWPQQQYLMIKEMAPAIYTKYKLSDLEKGAKWKSLSQTEAMSTWNGGDFYRAVKEFSAAKNAAGANLMGNTPALTEDYEFWIRTCVKWLFYKYQSLPAPKSWGAAVQAFNGSGIAAAQYKTDVMSRVGAQSDVSVN